MILIGKRLLTLFGAYFKQQTRVHRVDSIPNSMIALALELLSSGAFFVLVC